MLVTVKYFGMIAEQTNNMQETIDLEKTISIQDLEIVILSKYPALKDSTYNIALNQKIENRENLLTNGDELAFLPPFAGG